jgi:transposase
MNYYAGIDVSLEESCICVIDANGKVVREGKVSSEPTALIAWLSEVGVILTRIGLEAGPLSQWLYAAMRQAGLAVELLETRHVRNAFKIMPVKTDRKDARGIAELMRLGWFRPVHCKSMEAQETRAMLTARKLVQKELQETESSLRGILRGFGLKVGKTTPVGFEGRIRELVAGHPSLEVITSALLSVRAVLRRQFNEFERNDRAHRYAGTASDDNARRRRHRVADFCLCDRRPITVQIVEGRRSVFRHDANAISIRGNRLQRPDFKERGRLGACGALRGRSPHPDQAA